MSATILTSVLSFIGVLIVGLLVPFYLVTNASKERREDQAEAARLHREDRKAEWARQDEVAAKAETARKELAASQKAIADQAAEAASLLLARQNESAAAQVRVAAQAEEAARLLAENNHLVAKSAKETGLKLDTIHTLVNSNMTAAMESERAAVNRELTVMRELIALRKAMGQEPTQAALSAVAATQAKLTELETALAERARTQKQVNRQIGLDVITTTSYRQQEDGTETVVPQTDVVDPKSAEQINAETQGVDPPGEEPRQVSDYLDIPRGHGESGA